MKLDVPDGFINLLEEIEGEVPPRHVIEWLEWASDNPEEARCLVETYRGLGRSGRHEFAVSLLCGTSPDCAIKSALEDDESHRSKRSLISKAIADAKKGGYKFTMPNGVECTVVKDGDVYWFKFAGGEAGVLYGRRGLYYAIDAWKNGSTSVYDIISVFYKGKFYEPFTDVGKTIIEAMVENEKPEVLAAVNL